MQRGDIYLIDFEPTRGREQAGRRPALIISTAAFNKHQVPWVCPVTSGGVGARHAGFAISLQNCGTATTGVVLIQHLRALDLRERRARFIERAPDFLVDEVIGAIQDILESARADWRCPAARPFSDSFINQGLLRRRSCGRSGLAFGAGGFARSRQLTGVAVEASTHGALHAAINGLAERFDVALAGFPALGHLLKLGGSRNSLSRSWCCRRRRLGERCRCDDAYSSSDDQGFDGHGCVLSVENRASPVDAI